MRATLRQTRVRLALAYAGVFSIVAVFAAGALWLALARAEYAAIDEGLSAQAHSLVSTLASGGKLDALGDAAPAAILFNREGTVLERSATAPLQGDLLPLVQAAADSGEVVRTQTLGDVTERVHATRVTLGPGSSGVLVVMRDATAAQQSVSRTLLALLAGIVVLMVAATVIGYGLAASALRPVREIAAAARAFSDRDLHRRIELDLPPDELGELAETFNAMLERLETAFESLRRFTADAAHELRAPLTLIRTEAEVALARPRPAASYRGSLETIVDEAERLGRLADQLLMLARADAGALVPALATLDLATLIRETVARWQALAASRGLSIVVSDGTAGHVLGDADLLRRLFDNLIDNALRHSPEGGRVMVSTALAAGAWEVAVADEGPGVAPAMRSAVFERFTRADRARGRDTGGAGLGLALCAAIVQVHDGTIRLDESATTGARFVVRLPAAEPPAAAQPSPGRAPTRRTPAQRPGRNAPRPRAGRP